MLSEPSNSSLSEGVEAVLMPGRDDDESTKLEGSRYLISNSHSQPMFQYTLSTFSEATTTVDRNLGKKQNIKKKNMFFPLNSKSDETIEMNERIETFPTPTTKRQNNYLNSNNKDIYSPDSMQSCSLTDDDNDDAYFQNHKNDGGKFKTTRSKHHQSIYTDPTASSTLGSISHGSSNSNSAEMSDNNRYHFPKSSVVTHESSMDQLSNATSFYEAANFYLVPYTHNKHRCDTFDNMYGYGGGGEDDDYDVNDLRNSSSLSHDNTRLKALFDEAEEDEALTVTTSRDDEFSSSPSETARITSQIATSSTTATTTATIKLNALQKSSSSSSPWEQYLNAAEAKEKQKRMLEKQATERMGNLSDNNNKDEATPQKVKMFGLNKLFCGMALCHAAE